ncbi:MAG TPA: hypothetical protein VGC98_03660 [Thermoleophilaceae bacterium]|jgi:hypothetical protein
MLYGTMTKLQVVRWPVEPLADGEPLLLPSVDEVRAAVADALAAPPGAPLRRVILTRALQVGLAAVGRRDYNAWRRAYAERTEFHLDVADWLALGMPARSHSCEEQWRNQEAILEAFAEFRIEPNEFIDPGGSRFACRVLIAGAGRTSGIPMQQEHWYVFFLDKDAGIVSEHGVATEEQALATLAANGRPPPAETAADA